MQFYKTFKKCYFANGQNTVTSDVSYKGERIIGSCIGPGDPIKTVCENGLELTDKVVNCCTLVPLSTTSAVKEIYHVIVLVSPTLNVMDRQFRFYEQTTTRKM